MSTILIRKVSEPYGWLGNMSAFPVVWKGKTYRTTEALFQCLRFSDPEIIENLRSQKSPMAVKMVCKRHRSAMVVESCSAQDVENMRLCLRLKLEQHNLRDDLLVTGEAVIIEDCSRRPRGNSLFWGAALMDGEWKGENMLGKLWMELRAAERLSLLSPSLR
jgi:predicted NAD-dependent protein-ADP-ribosyltransferase YbiA (DUF1768 family)